MPANPRVRDNNVFGLVDDNPLSAVSATMNSAGLAYMSAVVSRHAVITLDPLRQYGEPEIIVVTAHSASSSVATILRGQYGTTARSHQQGTVWVHSPLDEDFIEIVTSVTRPSNPYEGQFIFETDTNKLVGYGGVDWAPRDAGGLIGFAQSVADQGSITAVNVDLTSLSVVVTVGTGRRILITGYVYGQNTAAGNQMVVRIQEGATQLNSAAIVSGAVARIERIVAFAVVTPSAGSHTYKLTADTEAGTMTAAGNATRPNYIWVEDIGAA